MGFFRRKPQAPPLESRLDWQILQNGAVALYHKGSVLSADLAWFRQQSFAVHELDASAWTSPADFHAEAQRLLAFPPYYGRNLAAWLDCLAELPVEDDAGAVIVFRHFDRFVAHQREFSQTLLDSIESTSRRFMLTGRRLIALVQSDDPRLKFERIGAVPVTWNPREWLDADRGVGP